MFRLSKSFTFEASHILPKHLGKCSRLHGHSWQGTITVEGPHLQTENSSTGMLQDFGDLKAAIQPLLDNFLDHHHLNETTGLRNPTSEEIARWIYTMLKPTLPMLVEVTIRETCTSSATYPP